MSRTTITLRSTLTALMLLGSMLMAFMAWGTPARASLTHPYTGQSFGPEGIGPGAFSDPVDVALDQNSGDVFVYDASEGGRIYKFDAAGNQLKFTGLPGEPIAITGVGGSAEGSEDEIAVDSSTGPDAGDIYVANNNVVSIYSAGGAPLGELSGGEACGVAIDASGVVYVGFYLPLSGVVRKYTPVVNPVANSDETASMGGLDEVCKVAADGEGNVYAATFSGGVRRYDPLQFGSLAASGTLIDEQGSSLDVDPLTNHVYINEGSKVVEYDSHGSLLGSSGAGNLTGSFGVAVKAGGNMYAPSEGRVKIFGPAVALPEVSIDVPSLSATVTLKGSVNPGGVAVSSCQFEYGTQAGVFTNTVACSPFPGSESAPVDVLGELSGLTIGATYHYRLIATTENGTSESEERSFTAPGPPSVSSEFFSKVGSSSATLSAQVSANGEPATFRVEYGLTTTYGLSTSSVSVGSASQAVGVIEHLSGLRPGATYHFRFLATNAIETAEGVDMTLTTLPPALLGLPDNRGYEMVTPVDNEDAELYAPKGDAVETGEAIFSEFPMRAAADGHAVAYVGEPTAEGNGDIGSGSGNEYMATRESSGGWAQKNIQPAGGFASPIYSSFSDDLSKGVLTSVEPLSAGVPSQYQYLYTRNSTDGGLRPLFTVMPPNRSPSEFGAVGTAGFTFTRSLGFFYAGASRDFRRLFFEANDALTADAVDGGKHENNLYESVEGVVRLVNILPNGNADPNAFFGAPPAESEEGENSDHAISGDGSRVFWTDMSTGALYMRENGTSTSLVDEHATFWTASVDGSRVLYAKGGDLYEDDLSTGGRTDLTPGGQVLGIVGASEDAGYVYFVAEGSLASGATAGQPNLYLHHGNATTFIATLAPENQENPNQFYGNGRFNDWRPGLGHRTAEVTPDGQGLVFMSVRSLTGYDNRNENGVSAREVYVYDAVSEGLSCISCDPSGEAPPTGREAAGYLPVTGQSGTYQLRLISEDGDRVVFQSTVPLVTQDVNGRLDVYEWEREGTGSCRSTAGCIYLLSSGSSQAASYLIDASADGSDVFISTRAQLVGADQNELYDLYDARVGAVQPLSPLQCTGSGCQGVPAAPPIFATPSSVTFNGIGNFSPPLRSAIVKQKKKKAKCSGAKRLSHGKCVKRKAEKVKAKANKTKAKKSAKGRK